MLNALIMMALLAGAATILWAVQKVFPGRDRPIHFVAIGVVLVGLVVSIMTLAGNSPLPTNNYHFEDDYSWARR
ncbi:hypothetical protein [Caulobacter segnis]